MSQRLEELHYYLAFSQILGIGPVRFDALLAKYGSVEAAYHAERGALTQLLGPKTAQKLLALRSDFEPEAQLDSYHKKGITVVPRSDPLFPAPLAAIADPPICLYVKGALELYDFDKEAFFAIVGTRGPTSYGATVAQKFAYELAAAGFIIVSGLALGVDAIAHRGALSAGARTIAFLGCGVDIAYPSDNRGLYEQILAEGGLVVSEFPPGQTVLPGLFVARNRLISGLSKGVLVVEGSAQSGTLITARYAAAQGKDVFAPPSPITSHLSEAPNMLLKQGAKLVTCVEDILEEYQEVGHEKVRASLVDLSAQEEALYGLLTAEPYSADDLAKAAKHSIHEVLQTLSMLEVRGVVAKNSEGKYQLSS